MNYTHHIQFLISRPLPHQKIGTPEGTRTPDLLLRRQLLYPAELLARMERVMGVEPTPTAWKAVVLAVILHPHGELYHQPEYLTMQLERCQAIFLQGFS